MEAKTNTLNSIIVHYRKVKGNIDINGSILCVGDKEFKIQHLTNLGYFSKSILVPFFEYEETTDGEGGQKCLSISDKTAEMIAKSNCCLNGKLWVDDCSTSETLAERNEKKYPKGVNMTWFD